MVKVFSMKVKGVDKLLRNIDKIENNIETQITSRLSQVALFMEGEVKQSIAGQKSEQRSVDTGRFLNSVFGNTSKFTARIISNVEYAKYLELGTSRILPRKHFSNSLKRNKDRITKSFRNLV